MRFTLIGVLIFGVLGCSAFTRTAPQQFVVERRWARSTLNQEFLGARRLHRFTPILTDTMVIAANAVDGVVAYNKNSAAVLWRFYVKGGVEGGAQLVDGVLYFGASDGNFYALTAENGKLLWSYPMKAEGLSEPLIHNGQVFVLGGNGVVHVLNAANGKLVWVYNRREPNNISVRGGSQPTVAGDLVLVGFADGWLVALNRTSGSVVWEANLNRNKRFRDVDASPVVDGDIVYASSYDGALYALNLSDGRILWTVDEGGYDKVLLIGNTVFYSTSTGKIMALDKASGKVVWSRTNPRGIATSPTFYKGVLMFGEMNGALRFLDARTGDFLGQFDPGRGVTSRAGVDSKQGDVYFVSHDANLFKLGVGWRRHLRAWPWE